MTTFLNGSYFTGSASSSALTSSGGVSTSSLYNTDWLERKYEYKRAEESYQTLFGAEDSTLQTQIQNICNYLKNGREDSAMEAYQKLLSQMSSQSRYSQLVGEDGDDTQLRAVARQLIEAELGGSLEDYIRENARDAAGVEAQKIRTFGNCDSTSQEDLLKEMCDIDEEKGHNLLLDAVSIVAAPFEWLGNLIFNGGKKVR